MNTKAVKKLLTTYGITNYSFDSEGLVDVKGDVDISNRGLEEIPISFGKINGNFDCSNNKLKTLENSPCHIAGSFNCCRNMLTDLSGCPDRIDGDFYFQNNSLSEQYDNYTKNYEPDYYPGFVYGNEVGDATRRVLSEDASVVSGDTIGDKALTLLREEYIRLVALGGMDRVNFREFAKSKLSDISASM